MPNCMCLLKKKLNRLKLALFQIESAMPIAILCTYSTKNQRVLDMVNLFSMKAQIELPAKYLSTKSSQYI